LQEVFGAPRKTVTRPDQHSVKFVATRVLQELIKSGTTNFRSTYPVIYVLLDNFKPTQRGELAQFYSLGFWILSVKR
jgi:hypothetical protein